MTDRTRARELAEQSIRRGDPSGWFEQLYHEAEQGKTVVPWADRGTNPLLLEFWEAHPLPSDGKSAVVVGCGLGDNAEQLDEWGFQTTAFDVSPTAVRSARKRFPSTRVAYAPADLFDPPAVWCQFFDFVLEIFTLQALPRAARPRAIAGCAELLRPGGHLLVIARGGEENDPEAQLPWPLTRAELRGFLDAGLQEVSFEDFIEPQTEPDGMPRRRFRVLYHRPPG